MSLRLHNWVIFLVSRILLKPEIRNIAEALYEYFREIDDYIDEADGDRDEKMRFLDQRIEFLDGIYRGDYTQPVVPLDREILKVVRYDLAKGSHLRAAILRMFEVFRFDAARKGRLITGSEILASSRALSHSFVEMLLYFVNQGYEYKESDLLLAHACHLIHMIRDYFNDQRLGYINIPKDEIARYNIKLDRTDDSNFRAWLRDRVYFIKRLLRRGEAGLSSIPDFRIRLIARLFSFRYEIVLKRIEENGYQLQTRYSSKPMDLIRGSSKLLAGLLLP